MRDFELEKEFERLTPRLDRLFSKVIRTLPGDPATQVGDLLQETVKGALQKSRLPQYDTYSCERLIMKRAYHLIWEYCHPPLKKQPALPLEKAERQAGSHEPEREFHNRQRLEWIHGQLDEDEWTICWLTYAGYKQAEMARHLGISLDLVKKKLQRAREKLYP
jgi:RNA polymerase sigma factor (sigma-70 family)